MQVLAAWEWMSRIHFGKLKRVSSPEIVHSWEANPNNNETRKK